MTDANHQHSGKLLMYHVQNMLSGRSHRIKFTSVARHDQRHLIARAHMVGRTTRNSHQQYGIKKKKNGPEQPTSPVSTHSEVVKTNKSETFDSICFDPSVNIARRSPRSGPGRTTVTRPEQPICRKSSECHSEVHIGAHKFDRLMQSV